METTAVYFVNQLKINSPAFHAQKMDRKFAISIGMEHNVVFTAKLLIQVLAMKMAREYAVMVGLDRTVKVN